ncbi:MAG: NAD(P)/FAD-dependent oxidoreductase, partial [Candidatus Latescibacterota bacterium]|nr:NAD(P)/FAD-dependent oxidoreductase [Candidatus Latescibacterota bacterium]
MNASSRRSRQPRIAIVGAGPGGLCMAIQLKGAGFSDFVLLEKGDGVGGTWAQNRYPGCACDIPSLLYAFSFEPNLDWSRPYAPQSEILAYMEHCAEKYDVLSHCRFQSGVKAASWEEGSACWSLVLDSGEALEVDVLISAVGMFNDRVWPDIDGIDTFAGTSFHSASWNWEHDLSGRDVAVIGSAASAVQFVPEIVKEANRVYLFQRTANWVMPKEDEPHSKEILESLRANPESAEVMRGLIYQGVDEGMTFSNPEAVAELEASVVASMEVVEDPVIREKLRPQHPFGCKRPLLSNNYFEAFNRPNLELVTESIRAISPDSVRTVDGGEYSVDTVVFATGFATTKYASAVDLRGRDGLRIADAWSDGAHAYLGILTAGFPNFFMLYGPNTNNGSILEMIEGQVEYTVGQIERLVE